MKNSLCSKIVIALVAIALLASSTSARADTTTTVWNGTNSSVWSLNTNWAGSVLPSTTVSALFNGTFTSGNQPTLGAAQITQGIWLATGDTQDVTIDSGAARVLTVTGTATLNSQTNAGIYMNDSANHNLTIGPNTSITLSNATGFYNQESSASTLTISGGLNLNAKALTIGLGATSTGNVAINSAISGTTGTITVNNAGTVTLGGGASNTYTGLTTVTSGTLLLAKTTGAFQAIGGALTIGAANNTAATVQYTGASTDMMGAGAVTINGRGILDFNGATDTIGNVAIVSTGATTSNPTPIINTAGGGNLTIGTLAITPVAGFTSQINLNGGTLTLGGAVTFTAATTGQAQISGNVSLGSATRTFTIASGSSAYDLDINGAISSGGVTTAGAGKLQFSGSTSNTYATITTTGGTGSLLLNKSGTANAIGAGGLSIGTGTSVKYVGASSDMIADAAPVTVTGTGQLNLNGQSDTIGALGLTAVAASNALVTTGVGTLTLGGNVTFTAATTGQAQISGNLALGGATRTFTVGLGTGATQDLLIDAAISDGGFGLIKAGTGRLALTGANGSSYTGPTAINAGTLNFGNHGLGDGSGTITLGGGTLQYAAAANTQDVSARLITTGANTLNIDANNNVVVFGSALTAANIAGTGGLTLTSTTAGGSLTLTGANTYTGLTTVGTATANSGTLKLATSSTLNSGNALTTLAGGTFDINGNSQTLGVVTNSGIITNSGAGTPTLTIGNGSSGGSFTGSMNVIASLNGSMLTTFANTGNVTFICNAVTNPTITAVNNIGTLTLTNTGTGTGNTTITTVGANVTGITQNSNISQLTITTLNMNAGGRTLTSGGASNLTVTNQITTGSSNLTLTANSTGNINLNGGFNIGGSILNNGGGTNTVTVGAIGALVTTGVTQNAANSILLLNGAGLYTGGTTITSGTLKVGNATALGANTSAVGVASGAVLDVNGIAMTGTNALTLNGSGIGGTGALIDGISTAATYAGAVNLASASTIGNAGTALFTVSGNVTGTAALTLKAAGTGGITLTNVNNTGTVTNSGGGTGTTTITTLGSNVTGLTEAGASPFTVTNAVGLTASLNSFTSTGSGLFTLTGQVTGAQNLTLSANSTGGITLTNGANIGGSILNNGSGTNTVTVGAIGALITTGVTQNAANSILLLNGAGLYTGGTTITLGTLKVGNATALGANTSAVSVSGSGAALDLNGTTMTGTNALTLNGTGINNGGALTNSSGTAGTYAGLVTLGSASSIVATGGNIILSNAGTITGSGFSLTLDGAATASSIASIIGTGSGTLTKQGGGTWTLSGANTYTGKTTISGGILKVSSLNKVSGGTASSNLGAPVTVANGTIDLNGGTLSYTGAGETTDRVINLGGAGSGGTIDSGAAAGTLNFTSDLTLTGTGNQTLYLSNSVSSGIAVFTGKIVDGSGGAITSVTKLGSGTSGWTLAGANTYTGKTSINGNSGPLKVSSINSVNGGTPLLASSSLGAPTTIANGTIDLFTGILTYTGTGETTDRVINLAGVAGVPYIDQSGTGLLKFTSNFTSTGNASKTLNLQGSTAGTGEVSGVIVDNNASLGNITSLTKQGTGTWTLSGANTYSGKTSILGGTLQVASLNKVAGGTASSNLGAPVTVANGTIDFGATNNGGTLVYNGTGETTDRVINLAGVSGFETIDQSGSGLLKFTSNLTATGAGSKTLQLQGSTAGTGEIGGIIVDNSALNTTSLAKTGTDTWVLSGANTYTGGTTVSQGTLTLSGANTGNGLISVSAGTLAISGSGTLGATNTPVTVSAGTLDLGGTSQTVGTVTLSGAGGIIQNGNLTGSSFTATNTTGTATVSASLQGSGVALTQTGSGGTLALTGNNTYTGATTVSAGTLSVSGAAGAINSSSGYAVNGGALTLDNTAASLERLNNSANVTLSLGGTLGLVQGNTTSSATENITNLAFDNGNSTVTISSAAGMVTTLAATGNLTRANNATGLVRGSSMGIQSTNVGKIMLGTLPSGANFVGAGGAPTSATGTTTKNLAIVPWLVGDTAVGNAGKAFVTYDNTGGLRPLVAGELDTLTAGYTTTGDNVSQTGTLTLTTVGHTFNSLFISGTSTLTGAGAGDSLTINSGALANSGATTITGFNSGISFGNGEGVITSIGALTISSTINAVGSTGITKAGAGTMTLTGTQSYTGATTVNQGTLKLGDGTTDATLASSGINTVTGATTNFNNIGASAFSGPLSGGGAFTKTGAGVLTLAGSSAGTGTGAGTLTITVGGVKLNTANALQNTTASIGMVNALTFNPGQTPFTIGGLAGAQNLNLVDTSSANITLQAGNNNASTTYSGILSGGGLVKLGNGTLTLSGVNTFSSLTIKNGTVQASTSISAFGAGSITLGDTTGSNAATLSSSINGGSFGNAIVLATNPTAGLLTITMTTNNQTFSGGVTGTNNLTINPVGSGTLTFSTAAVNNTGTVTNSGVGLGTGPTTIATIGSNVTGVTENSTASALTITTLNVNNTGAPGTTTLTNSSGTKLLTVTNTVVGTGNLVLNNNSATANGITLSGGANNAGTLTNSGTGTGAMTLAGVIGASVTGVVQNSATSVLTLTGTNTFTTGLTIQSGTAIGTVAASFGTGTVLLGSTGGTAANATLQAGTSTNGGITFTNPITVQLGNAGTATISNVSDSATAVATTTFSGTVTLNKNVTLNAGNATLAGGTSTSIINLSSIAGSGGINVTTSSIGVSSSGQSFGIGAGQVVLTAANSYGGDTHILSGSLILNSATNATMDSWVGTGSNPVYIGDTSGTQSARLMMSMTTNAAGQIFNKNIEVLAGNSGISGFGSSSSNANASPADYHGTITLDKSAYILGSSSVSGNIVSGSTIGAVSLTSNGTNSQNFSTLTGTKSYDGGTTVGMGMLSGSSTGGSTTRTFGAGNVVVETGVLHLGAFDNVATGKTIHVNSGGVVSIGNAAITQANMVSLIDATSSGAIGIGVAYSGNLDLSTIGNGLMYFGGEYNTNTGVYSGTSLGANSDGNYRLGFGTGGASTGLTISNGVLVDGTSPVHAAQLIVGGSSGIIGFAQPRTGIHTEGTVTLAAANTYTGGTIVNSGSFLIGNALASGSVFGSTTGALSLRNGTLKLANSGATTTTTTVGALDYSGAATLQVNGLTAGSNTLIVGQIAARTNNGTLTFATSGTGAVLGTGGTAFIKTSGTAPATFATVSTDGIGGTAAMLAPYFTDSVGNYMSYDATNGFTPIATTVSTFASLPTNAFVKTAPNGGAALSIAANATVAALDLAESLTSSVVGDVTLTINTGGLNDLAHGLSTAANSGLVIGSAGTTNHINLNFNGQEAVIGALANQNGGMTIYNTISNTNGNGLTKFGTGNLTLADSNNSFTGLITINNGSLQVAADGALGAATNSIYLNGGTLYTTASGTFILNASRTITLGQFGGSLGTGTQNGGSNAQSNLTVNGLITGTGAFLALGNGNALTSSYSTNTFTFANASNDFTAPIYLGTNMISRVALAFSDNGQLGNAANAINLVGGNSSLQYTGGSSTSMNRALVFADLGGAIDVVTSGVVLTNNGTVSGSGVFDKAGLGTLALTGSSASFSGTINIDAGVLNVSHADALGATTAVISGNTGVSGGATYVQNGAALEVKGNIALGNAGGKTLYLNGTGISNGGALRNVSDTNSNAGAVVLQSNTTIGADAGKLTLYGVVSGAALTKVGGGTVEFTGANTYTGGTIVSAGTLLVNNTSGSGTGTGSVTVTAGGTLGGSGTISGAVTLIGGTLLPGNSPGLLTMGSLQMDSSSTTVMQLDAITTRGTTYDAVNVGASLVYGGTLTIDLNPATAVVGSYDLFDFASQSGAFSAINFVDAGAAGTFNYTTGVLNLTSVPEPATWGLLAFSLTTVLVLRRRRKE